MCAHPCFTAGPWAVRLRPLESTSMPACLEDLFNCLFDGGRERDLQERAYLSSERWVRALTQQIIRQKETESPSE